ncbi:hypothetical protein NKG05_30755 [Oerskovia sp. M15]
MIDLHHTTVTIDYVATKTFEDHLAATLPAVRPAVAFELYRPRAGEPTDL